MRVTTLITLTSAEATRRVKIRVAPRGALMVGDATSTAIDAMRLRPGATGRHAAS